MKVKGISQTELSEIEVNQVPKAKEKVPWGIIIRSRQFWLILSMYWFYPILAGVLTGSEAQARIEKYWKKYNNTWNRYPRKTLEHRQLYVLTREKKSALPRNHNLGKGTRDLVYGRCLLT